MNYLFLYCIVCFSFCVICGVLNLWGERIGSGKVTKLVVKKWIFWTNFTIFFVLTLFLPVFVWFCLQKLSFLLEFDENETMVLSMLVSQLLTVLFIYKIKKPLALADSGLSFGQALCFGLRKFGCTLPIILIVSALWVAFLQVLKNIGLNVPLNAQSVVVLFSETNGVVFRLIFFILVVFIAPFIEEYVFRAGIYRALKSNVDTRLAMICTSTIFAVMHLNLISIVPLFVLSQFLIKYYECSGDIRVPIIIHGAFNFNSIMLMSLAALPGSV